MGKRYLNIDELVPDEQLLTIAGRVFDVSKTPARQTTELLKVASWASSPEIKGDPSRNYEAYTEEMQALVSVLGNDQDGEPATFEWVVDNVNNAQLQAIIEFIGECLRGDEVAAGEVEGNFTQKTQGPNRATRRAAAKKKK